MSSIFDSDVSFAWEALLRETRHRRKPMMATKTAPTAIPAVFNVASATDIPGSATSDQGETTSFLLAAGNRAVTRQKTAVGAAEFDELRTRVDEIAPEG
jgi:hypothetical protein